MLAIKRVLWRWDRNVFPCPALTFDDVFNRRTANALRRRAERLEIGASGNLGKTTFNRLLGALRDRGDGEPHESAWDKPAIDLYKRPLPRKKGPAKCFVLPAGAEVRNLGGVSAHMSKPLGNWQSDNAIDVGSTPRTLILAPKAGFVSKIGGADPHDGPVGTIFGEHITIECPDGDAFFMTYTEPIVGIGEKVVAGEVIGRIADWSGARALEHVHVGRG